MALNLLNCWKCNHFTIISFSLFYVDIFKELLVVFINRPVHCFHYQDPQDNCKDYKNNPLVWYAKALQTVSQELRLLIFLYESLNLYSYCQKETEVIPSIGMTLNPLRFLMFVQERHQLPYSPNSWICFNPHLNPFLPIFYRVVQSETMHFFACCLLHKHMLSCKMCSLFCIIAVF